MLAQPECFYWIRKLQARFIAGDYISALDASLKAEPLLWTAPSNLELAEYHLYGGLCRASLWDFAPPDQRQQHLDALATHHRRLEIWAENCPDNFENQVALVGAEIARIEGRVLDAEHLYQQAIRSASANGFVHNEAVAYEVAHYGWTPHPTRTETYRPLQTEKAVGECDPNHLSELVLAELRSASSKSA